MQTTDVIRSSHDPGQDEGTGILLPSQPPGAVDTESIKISSPAEPEQGTVSTFSFAEPEQGSAGVSSPVESETGKMRIQSGVEEDKPVKEESIVSGAYQQKQQKGNIFAAVNRPWVLLTIPLVGGSIWLADNTWIITQNLDKPYALLAGPTLVASIVLGWMLITFFRTIASWCTTGWRAFNRAREEDSSAQFFWVVIVVFMLVSVFASGNFFSMLEHNTLPLLGYATALFIDLVAVQAMRARLNAVRMRDRNGSRLYLFGVLLCAGASAFANVYTSLADFDQKVSGSLPPWMLLVAPWFGLVFPALILLLSVTADYTIDQISSKLDPEQYKEQETKRIRLLEYQRDALRKRVGIENEIDRLTTQLQSKKEQRTFFLINWLFPVRRKVQNSQQMVEEIMGQVRPWFDTFEEKYSGALLTQQQTHGQGIVELQGQVSFIQNNIANINTEIQLLGDKFQVSPISSQALPAIQNNEKQQDDRSVKLAAITRVLPIVVPEDLEQETLSKEIKSQIEYIDASENKENAHILDTNIESRSIIESQGIACSFEEIIASEDTIQVNENLVHEQHTDELHLLEGTFLDEIAGIRLEKELYQQVGENPYSIGFARQENQADQQASSGELDSETGKAAKKASRSAGTMTYGEVARKFGTTIRVVEEAIEKGDLKLSRRGPNKILISSLSNFTPPPRRRRRVKAEGEQSELQLEQQSESQLEQQSEQEFAL